MKKPKGMSFHYCQLCERLTIICTCGNNACNGANGEIVYGNGCDCSLAYEYQNYIYSKKIIHAINKILGFFVKIRQGFSKK